jgi:hypothetical protein
MGARNDDMKNITQLKRIQIPVLFTVLALIGLRSLPAGAAETNPLETIVSNFSCSNVPVAVAVRNLSAQSPIPLNIVIDVIPQPVVTVAYGRASIGYMLKELLASLPNYATMQTNGTVLLMPKQLIGNDKSPLMWKLDRFPVLYRSMIYMSGATNYVCDFYYGDHPELNVAFNGMLRVDERTARLGPIPRVRTFKAMNLIEILTVLSGEEHQSWSLSRVWPGFVRDSIRRRAEDHTGPSQWSDPEAPCYAVFWRPLPSNGDERAWYGP